MNVYLKIASVGTTIGFVIGAVAIGGGTPLSPAAIADAASRAAANARAAEENTAKAAQDSAALEEIARNVASQAETSEKLLETQLALEESSRRGAARAKELTRELGRIAELLDRVVARMEGIAGLAATTLSATDASATAADSLMTRLTTLEARFRAVVEQSRRLNRKARGYEEAKP